MILIKILSLISVISFLTSSTPGLAQELFEDQESFVFRESTDLYADSGLATKFPSSLKLGDTVRINSRIIQESSKDLFHSSYKITTMEGNRTGFIRATDIALASADIGKLKVLVGITKIAKAEEPGSQVQYNLSVKTLRDERNVFEIAAPFTLLSGGYVNIEVENDARGLDGYSNLVFVKSGYEACGHNQYSWPLLWNGKIMTPLPELTGMSEAGISAAKAYYQFPAGKSGSTLQEDRGHYGDPKKVLRIKSQKEIHEKVNGEWTADTHEVAEWVVIE